MLFKILRFKNWTKEKKKFLRLGGYNLPESFPDESKLSIQILGV